MSQKKIILSKRRFDKNKHTYGKVNSIGKQIYPGNVCQALRFVQKITLIKYEKIGGYILKTLRFTIKGFYGKLTLQYINNHNTTYPVIKNADNNVGKEKDSRLNLRFRHIKGIFYQKY